MFDWLVDFALSSRWTYLIIFGIAAGDAFLPLFPSETAVIAAGVLAATDRLSLELVILSGGLGALVGDNVTYLAGRKLGRPAADRLFMQGRVRNRLEWAEGQLQKRGAYLIVIARFIPGGRTATTFTAGLVHYRWPKFAALTVVAAAVWASYAALLGYFGGRTFEENPLYGLLLALGIAFAVALAVEGYRHFVRERGSS